MEGVFIMKNNVLIGAALSLTLAATPAFTANDATLPTAESAVKKACEETTEITANRLRNILTYAKEADNTSEATKARKKEFARLAAPYVVDAISDLEKIRASLRETMLGLSKSYVKEISVVEQSYRSGDMPFGVYLGARIDIRENYEYALKTAMKQGMKNAGFKAEDDDSGKIWITTGATERGITLHLTMDSNDTSLLKVEYKQSKPLGSGLEGMLTGGSEDILFSDDFSFHLGDSTQTLMNLGINSGSYGRAGIAPTDSNEDKAQKMAARFIEVGDGPLYVDESIVAGATADLKKVRDFCAKPFTPK